MRTKVGYNKDSGLFSVIFNSSTPKEQLVTMDKRYAIRLAIIIFKKVGLIDFIRLSWKHRNEWKTTNVDDLSNSMIVGRVE